MSLKLFCPVGFVILILTGCFYLGFFKGDGETNLTIEVVKKFWQYAREKNCAEIEKVSTDFSGFVKNEQGKLVMPPQLVLKRDGVEKRVKGCERAREIADDNIEILQILSSRTDEELRTASVIVLTKNSDNLNFKYIIHLAKDTSDDLWRVFTFGKHLYDHELKLTPQELRFAVSGKNELLNGAIDLCRFQKADFLKTTDSYLLETDRKIYELQKAGFPEEISFEEGVAIFNKMEKCYDHPSGFVPLTVEEVKSALKKENCESYSRYNDQMICYKRKTMLENGKFAKGSFLGVGSPEIVRGRKPVQAIWLEQEMDKYRKDLKYELRFYFPIRIFNVKSAKKK